MEEDIWSCSVIMYYTCTIDKKQTSYRLAYLTALPFEFRVRTHTFSVFGFFMCWQSIQCHFMQSHEWFVKCKAFLCVCMCAHTHISPQIRKMDPQDVIFSSPQLIPISLFVVIHRYIKSPHCIFVYSVRTGRCYLWISKIQNDAV